MREQQWQRMVRVMRETGDKAFIVDMESDDVFMMMNLDDYESLVGLDSLDDEASDDDDEDDSPLGDYILDDIIDTPEKNAEKKELKKETSRESFTETFREPIKEIKKENFKITQPEPLPVTVEPIGESGLVQQDLGPKTMAETSANEQSIKDVPNDGEEEKFNLEPLE